MEPGPGGRPRADRHVLRQQRRARRRHLAARGVHRAAQAGGRRAGPVPLADGIGRVQALHPRRLPGRLPHRCAVPHRVRHRGRPGGRVQRLRLLHSGLPLRGHRPAAGRRPGLEVHAVLRPAGRRPGAGLRQGLPDRVDPVRAARRTPRSRRGTAGATARRRRRRRAAVRGGPGRRRRRGRRVLPAAGRAGGVWAAARPGRHHPRPARHVAAGRRGRRRAGRRHRRRLRRRRAGRAQVSESEVTREGLRGVRPGRDATPGTDITPGTGAGRRRRGRAGWRDGTGRRGEQPMVPPAEFASYYGRPILNAPVWRSPDIPGYLFLGGLAGGSSLLAAGAQLTGRPALARASKTAALGAACLGLAGLVHDLGRPARFANMLRVFKVTSPMSVGSWILSGYVPAAGTAAACALTGRLPRTGAAATAGAAVLAPGLASYTAALITDTAVPAWHEGYREMPFVFTGSAAMASGGLGLLAAPLS